MVGEWPVHTQKCGRAFRPVPWARRLKDHFIIFGGKPAKGSCYGYTGLFWPLGVRHVQKLHFNLVTCQKKKYRCCLELAFGRKPPLCFMQLVFWRRSQPQPIRRVRCFCRSTHPACPQSNGERVLAMLSPWLAGQGRPNSHFWGWNKSLPWGSEAVAASARVNNALIMVGIVFNRY